MGKQQSQQKPFGPEDYNEPTEPFPINPVPYYPQSSVNDPFHQAPTAAASPPEVQPYIGRTEPIYPYHQPPQNAYPVLPPLQRKKQRGSPPGGAPRFSDPVPVARRRRRSPWPGLVRFGFVLVQLILLARVLCLLFAVQNTSVWLTLLSATGDLLVQPVRLLAENINVSILAGTPLLVYLEFLVAILAYGLFSRILTFLLRAILN